MWAAVGLILVILAHLILPATAAKRPPCRTITHEGARYTVCDAHPARHTIRLAWRRPNGTPYAILAALPTWDRATRRPLLFALNAGMYDSKLKPVGLYIERGRRLVRANTRNGRGNFHLKPNGVFFIANGRAQVLETRAYLKRRLRPEIATQSGPMLVIADRLHPKFKWAERSKKMRNGVGVNRQGKVLFAISETPVSLASFGRLYRDVLNCPNALFLDGGTVPTLYAPALGRASNFLPMGPMLAVYGQ